MTLAVFYLTAIGRVFALRAPWHRPLFSERARRLAVFHLGFGWRITVRKIADNILITQGTTHE